MLETGTKVFIAHRRLYEGDHGRFFVGVVEEYEAGVARIEGHTWLRSGYDGTYYRKDDLRTKIVPILSGSFIVYQLHTSVHLKSFRIETVGTKTVARADGGFLMDLSEATLKDAA